MDKNLQNIEDLFKKGLEGNEESPSEEVWNTIDQSLEKDNSLKFKKKYYSLKRATAILVVVLALLSIYVLRNESRKKGENKTKSENVAAAQPVQKNDVKRNPDSSSGKINEIPLETPAERKAPINRNLNPKNNSEIAKSGSQQSGNSLKSLKPGTPILPNPARINEANKKVEVANNLQQAGTRENISEITNHTTFPGF